MTYEEKFKFLLSNDLFFKNECLFLIKKWRSFNFFKKRQHLTNVPSEYLKDLNFVIHEANLPARFTKLLHNYLQTQKIPKNSTLPNKIETFIDHDPRYNSGKIIMEIDIDARLSDIKKEWKGITDIQKLLNKMILGPKISQPIRKPKIIARLNRNESLTKIAFDTRDWTKKDDKKERRREMNALKVMRFRIKKRNIGLNRTTVNNRKKVENYYNNQKTPF